MKKLYFFCLTIVLLFTKLTQAQYSLTINYDDMEAYIGNDLGIRITEWPSGKEVARKVLNVEDTSFSVVLYVLLEGRTYHADFFADANGNGQYDPPPADHAWRRLLSDPDEDVTINFSPDTIYTNIPFPEILDYSSYASVWGGKWMNLTFGSTDSIMAEVTIECDSVFGSFSTKGVFGNPNTVEFNYAEARPAGFDSIPDTLRIALAAPWTGHIQVVQEQLYADLENNGLGLDFIGTIGLTQIMGLYNVSVGDTVIANGFFYVKELEVLSSVPEFEIAHVDLDNVLCANGTGGSISVTVEGGVPGYSFQWSNGDTTSTIAPLTAGTYTVTITDAAGCVIIESFGVTEPEPLNMDITVTDVSCFGLCDASLEFEISGGTQPYSLDEPNELCAGNYTITLTDANGCFDIDEVTINSPDELVIDNVVVGEASNGSANGSITVEVSGGISPFVYSIDGISFQSSNVFTGLASGYYTVAVRDANGCIVELEVFVFDLTSVDDLKARIQFYPNPASTWIYFESDIPVSLDLMQANGLLLQKETNIYQRQINIADLTPGMYILRISDGTGSGLRKFVKI